jgi:NSS family neurotransmitter:Na+ symporter
MVGLHVSAVVIAAWVLAQGVQKGFERANKILIPTLFSLLVVICVVSLTMGSGNGIKGLEYMFNIQPELFGDPKIWIEALSQSAWSTGAGWGLMMTISSYSRQKEDVSLNIFIGAFGNNTASILAGMAILPAVFALASSEAAAISYLQQGNFALTFNVIPQLFAQVPGGGFLALIFFGAFALAGFTSLLSMIELLLKIISDLGYSRNQSVIRGALICIIFGVPSAWSLNFFENQDWVWGIGLVVSGLFIIFAVLRHGIQAFKDNFIDKDSDFEVNDLYFKLCMFVNIPLGLILIYWWMSQGYSKYPWFDANGNWNVFDTYSNASIVSQWALVIVVGVVLNRYLYRRFGKEEDERMRG